MSKLKKTLFSLILIAIVCGSFLFWVSQQYTVPILDYHSFEDIEWSPTVTSENFSRQLEYIKKKGYDVITLDELVEGIRSGRRFKKNKVVITIDDGYSDNFKYAYPALKKFGFPATVFIIAAFIGEDPDYLTWDEVKVMANDGISFGSHTVNHLCLENVLDDEVLEEEIAGSKKLIERKLGKPVDYFCYPVGAFTEKAKKVVIESGYKAAFTTNRGLAKLNKDLYELRRIKVTNSDTHKPFGFWIKLSGYYNIFRSTKKGSSVYENIDYYHLESEIE